MKDKRGKVEDKRTEQMTDKKQNGKNSGETNNAEDAEFGIVYTRGKK
ncbi:hypothetical protein MM300_20720 [Evansella sp. LMS18]|nr:hypothetical protein [Evansella sp. LMS18]UTR10269.1 hypothetical protein MM300_20720 [Evansella sp. LMS18]